MGYAIYWSKNQGESFLLNHINVAAANESLQEIKLISNQNKQVLTNSIEWNWLSSILENNNDRHIDLDSDDLNHCFA